MSEADLRRGLEEIIERPIDRNVWRIWKEASPDIQLALEDLESGQALEVAVDALVDEYELLESVRTGRTRKRRRSQAEVKVHVRLSALAAIVAIEAQKRADVNKFRSAVLRGNLVKPKNIGGWIERRRRADPPVTHWRRVPVERGGGPVRAHDAAGYRPISESVETLEYALPGADAPSYVFIAADGVLGRLKTLCEALEAVYTWREAYALALVVSGEPPPLPLVRVTKNRRVPYPMLGQIDLQANPSLSTGELAPFYTAARRDFMPREMRRDIAPETAELGIFASRVNDGRTWEEALSEWNDTHDRQFQATPNFTTRCRDAYKKITGHPLDWKRGQGERRLGSEE